MKKHTKHAEEFIRLEAFLLSENAGHPHGMETVFWAQAEAIVNERLAKPPAPKTASARKASATGKPAAKPASGKTPAAGQKASKSAAAVAPKAPAAKKVAGPKTPAAKTKAPVAAKAGSKQNGTEG